MKLQRIRQRIRGKKIPVRFPVPRPTRIHGALKGAKAYKRSEHRRLERQAMRGDAHE